MRIWKKYGKRLVITLAILSLVGAGAYGQLPKSKERYSTVHDIVKATVSTTGIFNRFFFNMDKAFGYLPIPEEKLGEWWETEHSIVGKNY